MIDCIQNDWLRMPGLFRRFEFEQVIEAERELYVESAGRDEKGVDLYRIYYRSGHGPSAPRAATAAQLAQEGRAA